MRFFVDCEFFWEPERGRLQPISVGVVDEEGREFYAVSMAFNAERADQWLHDNVLAKLPDAREQPSPSWMPLRTIGVRLRDFVGDDTPEWWGEDAAFDYVVLSMVMGGFADWPQGWPYHINDLHQAGIPSVESENPHQALADAHAVRAAWLRAQGDG